MSELRQDLVSGDWIIVSPERFRKVRKIFSAKKKRKPTPVSKCPFRNLKKSGNWPPICAYPNRKDWDIVVIPNKYPALAPDGSKKIKFSKNGPYKIASGVGHHELLITKSHTKNIAHLSVDEGVRIFKILQGRFRKMLTDKNVFYASLFKNWGKSAGASLYHPHIQLIGLPIIPPDVEHSLNGSAKYYRRHKKCVHCEMIDYEISEGKRILFKTDKVVAFTPFFSREPFEIRIFPLNHQPYFERAALSEIRNIVLALKFSLLKIERNLNDADFNFFIHTAPLKKQNRYKHYHWHIEVIPKVSISAGFELSTGVEINVVDPNCAAGILMGKKNYD